MNTNPKKPLVYVVPDIERALGREPLGEYFVITNKTPYAEDVAKHYPNNIWLVESEKPLDTYELLSRPDVSENITKYGMEVLVFKNTPRIERIAEEKGWNLLNPSAEIAKEVEEKISQVSWLGELGHYLPTHTVTTVEKASFSGERFVLQFNHSHTGEGTFVIQNQKELAVLQEKFPKRECRITSYIEGPMFTVNIVVSEHILVGNISFQITGITPFTDSPLSTIGNDWKLPYKILKKENGKKIEEIAQAVGIRLRDAGWRGLFGIDVIHEPKTDAIYLIEINARQPASTTLESQLQKKSGLDTTVFDAHISALRNEKISRPLQIIKDGAQIIQRVTKERNKNTLRVNKEKLQEMSLNVIPYEHDGPNEDLVRITSEKGIMDSPTDFNDRGRIITSSLS